MRESGLNVNSLHYRLYDNMQETISKPTLYKLMKGDEDYEPSARVVKLLSDYFKKDMSKFMR